MAISLPLDPQQRRLSNVCLVSTWMGNHSGTSIGFWYIPWSLKAASCITFQVYYPYWQKHTNLHSPLGIFETELTP
jgi:hypothetical protein